MKRRLAFAVVCVAALNLAVIAAAPPLVPSVDDPGGFWGVLPAGQEGNANSLQASRFLVDGTQPPHWTDQRSMYDRLAREWPSLRASRITEFYKIASFNVPGDQVESVQSPKPGVKIVRDRFGVPHVYGATDVDTLWGAGWVTGDDRMFLADVLRHLGRGRVAEFLGASEANLAMDRDVIRVTGYSEEELQQQVDQLPVKFGALGLQTLEAFQTFTEGMNAWIAAANADPGRLPAEYPLLQLRLEPWKTTDSVAVAALIQAIFAAGGGSELENAALLRALEGQFPGDPARAQRLYRDLLVREDPEAPVTTEASFPYLESPATVDMGATAIPDPGSVEFDDPIQTLRESFGAAGLGFPSGGGSNWLAVDAAHAEGGVPVGVMGPQVGYFSPEILMEMALHGPTIDARGATFPGISLSVLLGRGIDFAWSATSGNSDLVDLRAERLCEPDGSPPTARSTHYLFQGECRPMVQRTDRYVAKPTAGGVGEPTVVTIEIERTVHGPVIGRATVDGAPVAISLQRSTWFGEVDSAPAFLLLNRNDVRDPQTFFDALNHVAGTFNWLFVDESQVAYFHSGLYPRRPAGVDPELPTWGTGEWEWQGFLGQDEHPHVTLGPGTGSGNGFITSWNNKPARGWRAADGNYGFGPIHRVQSLNERLGAELAASATGRLSTVEMIRVMADAATVDLRGTQVLPRALQMLSGRASVAAEVALLRDWVEAGAHRIDRDRDGSYEDEAAIALLDAWYDRMVDAVLDEITGLPVPMGRDDANRRGHAGSAFQSGWYHWLQKSFRQALGETPAEPLDEIRCGDGTAAGCADVLEASLQQASAALEAQFGGGPSAWRAPKSDEEIRFSTVGIVTVPPIDWQNRPTWQLVARIPRARRS
jgi:acyl-homoserine lactone acylase PvdQ